MSAVLAECWCCGRDRRIQRRGKGEGLCETCAGRWACKGWTGPGPGLEFVPQAERAREYAHVITTLSARQAAEKLGIAARTVTRWRRALEHAS